MIASDRSADIDSTRAEVQDALESMGDKFLAQTNRALVMWAIRWSIGFAIIWAVTSWTGQFDWLWTAGIVVAVATLVFTLAMRWVIAHKINNVRERKQQLDDMLAELNEEEDK